MQNIKTEKSDSLLFSPQTIKEKKKAIFDRIDGEEKY